MPSLLTKIRRDGVLAYILPISSNRLALGLYRLSNLLHRCYIPEIPYLIFYLNAILTGSEIHYKSKIGKSAKIIHSRGVVIGRSVKIGSYVRIYSGVVIGKKNKHSGMPVIGDNVLIGANTVLVGDILIGDNVRIGANLYVDYDVKNSTTIVSKRNVFEKSYDI